jgi:hypothetical protein
MDRWQLDGEGMRYPANVLAVFFRRIIRATLSFALLWMQFQMGYSGALPRGPVRFDQLVGSPAIKAAENAALMANEDLQVCPKIASGLFLRYLGALLARLGKSNRNRLLAAGHFAALAAFA